MAAQFAGFHYAQKEQERSGEGKCHGCKAADNCADGEQMHDQSHAKRGHDSLRRFSPRKGICVLEKGDSGGGRW